MECKAGASADTLPHSRTLLAATYAAPLQARRMLTTVASGDGKTPLEVIQQENELLRRTIEAADSSVEQLEQELKQSGVAVPSAGKWEASDTGVGPSAQWSPARAPCDGGILDESKLPPMSTVPDHDGTECLKWDDTLWSHAEHFKYRWGVYKDIRNAIDEHEGGMDSFTKGAHLALCSTTMITVIVW